MSKEPNRNVYVGHRYVPKVMGEWDKSIDYEGLSIVTNEGASYTSKKRVPVGIDIKNEEFWVVTGNYDAQVEYYRQDVIESENRINENFNGFTTGINEDFNTFKTDINGDINGFKTDINADFNSFKTDINNDFNDFENESSIEYNNFKDVVDNKISNKVNQGDLVFNIKDFGAVGDKVTDDTQAIKDTVIAIGDTQYATLYFPHSDGFIVKDTINVPANIHVIMDSPVFYDDVHDRTVLSIGDETKNSRNTELRLNAESLNGSNWTNENYIGIRVINCYSCDISIMNAKGFTINTEFLAVDWGFAFNNIKLYYFRNGKVGLQLKNRGDGWVNANSYYGGLFSGAETGNTTKDHYGVKITADPDATFRINSNTFYSPAFESGDNNMPVFIESGNWNRFVNVRNERTHKSIAMRVVGGQYNEFNASITQNAGTDILQYNPFQGNIFTGDKGFGTEELKLIFNSGNLGEHSTTNSEGNVKTNNLNYGDHYDTEIKALEYSPDGYNLEIKNNGLVIPSPLMSIGFYIDTSVGKEFIVHANTGNQNVNLFIIVPYDENGNMLTGFIPNDDIYWNHTQYVKPNYEDGFILYSGYSGNVYQSERGSNELRFKVKDEVKEVRVMVKSGSGSMLLKDIKVYGDVSSSVYSKIINN